MQRSNKNKYVRILYLPVLALSLLIEDVASASWSSSASSSTRQQQQHDLLSLSQKRWFRRLGGGWIRSMVVATGGGGSSASDGRSISSSRKRPSDATNVAATTTTTTTTAERSHDDHDVDDDEERYSRQVYTLGARAHKLIRSSIVYLDGPPNSGLLYETAKNLALSGVGRIVILVQQKEKQSTGEEEESTARMIDKNYHNAALDDLGAAYLRAAQAEVGGGTDAQDLDPSQLLVGYIQRLNPSVVVTTLDRSQLLGGTSSTDDNCDDGREGDDEDTTASTTTRRPQVLVALDRPFTTQVALNHRARESRMAFVAVEAVGVYGRVFCDFGPTFQVHDADGETPLVTQLDRVELVLENENDASAAKKVVVHTVEGEKHDVSKGDVFRFQMSSNGNPSEGQDEFVVEDVYTPFRFAATMISSGAGDNVEDAVKRINKLAATFSRIKMPQILSFRPLDQAAAQALEDPSLFTPCDLDKSFDGVRRNAVFLCFQALSWFVERNGRLPGIGDANTFEAQVLSSNDDDEGCLKEEFLGHCRRFLHGCAARFSPLQCIFGAIGAQEALKSASGLYFPTHQFLLYDVGEVVPVDVGSDKPSEAAGMEHQQSPGLRHIIGNTVADSLQVQRIFVVGAGAIGCELLKNLASMGVASAKNGKIYLTDMDTIEKSNLSRQLLFRDSDIGKFKSRAAQQAALRFNPDILIEAHSSKVGGSDPSPFDSKFWSEKIDIVLNALDNVEARLYMDRQCVANEKALVDAGTMGPKGNVQVVVPHQSESYASSVDPPEAAVPVCTLKNFPYVISHTIQWGRDLFDGYFTRRPNQANNFLESLRSSSIANRASSLVHEKGDEAALKAAEELSEDLAIGVERDELDRKNLREMALSWASKLATKLFYEAALELLREHPLGSSDEDGELFWSGTRRPPKALRYVASLDVESEQARTNKLLLEFVQEAARLRLETFVPAWAGEQARFTAMEAELALSSSDSTHICRNDEICDPNQPVTERIQSLLANISVKPLRQRLSPIEFEKDDDTNGHVAFVNAASNLRAIAYGIPPVDAMETRRVAGNIVPAMITTTAFVSALSCVELVKLAQNAPLTDHRNAFINLALPFFAFTVPLPAEQMPGLKGEAFTLWNRVTINEGKKAATSGGLTLRSLIQRIKKKATKDHPGSVEVTSISCGPYMLYANFLHEEDESVLGSSIWDLIRDASTSADEFDEARESDKGEHTFEIDCSAYADFVVVVEDLESGDEVELPPVRVSRYSEKD